MWLRSVYTKTLRDHRFGALAWAIGPGLLMTATLTQFEQLVGTPEQRGALVALAEQFSWYEAPIGITRPGGFVTFRLGPMLGILPSIWALLAASGQLRGEEERGALDLVLAAPISRTRVVLEKLAALGSALLALALVLGSIVAVAGSAARAEFSTLDAYVFALNVALTAGVYGAIALLISQFVSERSTAAGATGVILALSFLLHSTGRVAPDLKWLGYLSPLYYAGLTKPLVPEVGINPGGMLVLLAIVLGCASASAWLFTRRDLGFALRLVPARALAAHAQVNPATFVPSRAWSLRSAWLRALRATAGAAVWWAIGAIGYATWMTAVGKQVQRNLTETAQASPALSAVFARLLGSGDSGALFLNMLIFTFVPLALSGIAISHASRWAADEESGLSDMLLANTVSRTTAILAHFGALGLVLVAVTLLLGLAVGLAAASAELTIDPSRLFAASIGLAPVLFLVACIGALLSGWLRSGAVSAGLTLYVVGSFFLMFLGPVFGWPRWVVALSVFDAYGSPLVDGWRWGPMLAVSAVAIVALGGAMVRFGRKDVSR